MRQSPWPGLRQNATDLGSSNTLEFHNVQTRILGEVRDRPGLGTRYALSASLLNVLESTGGRHLIGYKDDGTLNSINLDTAATTALKSGLTASTPGCFAQSLGALYWVNGVDTPQVIYRGDQTANDAGIVGPVAAPTAGTPASGVITAGVHLIRYRYKNNTTDFVSNPSPALEFTAAGSQNCPLTLVASLDAKVDQIIVEMTEAAGSTFYVVATTTNTTSYTINMSDVTLAQQQQANIYSAPDGFGMDPPPASLFCIVEHRNRLFGLASDGTLYWSRAAYPEGWNILDWAKKVFSTGGDKPVALASFFGDLYIFGTQSMARMVYTADPASGMLVQIPSSLGVFNQRCVVSVEGAVYGFGRQGIFVISAIQPNFISAPVQKTLQDDVDGAYTSDYAHAFFDPNERVVWFMYRAVGDTGVRSAVCYDLESKTWSTRSFLHKIAASTTAGTTTTVANPYLADANGWYSWTLEDGVFDGASSLTSGVITVNTGSTTSIIQTVTAVPTSPNIIGSILYNPATEEYSTITGNTASTITISPAWASAPAAGTEVYVGVIEQAIRSGWCPMKYASIGRRPSHLIVEHLSVGDAQGVTFNVEYFLDYGTSAFVWTSVPDDQPMLGQTIVNGQNYATQQMNYGRAMMPVPSNYEVVIQWRLSRVRPVGHMRLMDCDFDVMDQRGAQDVGT